jgi:mRNA-degrading endonuclease RelE of RelBE toxin-antitoxin system
LSAAIRNGESASAITVVYEIDDAAKTVDVTRIAHRRDVYE